MHKWKKIIAAGEQQDFFGQASRGEHAPLKPLQDVVNPQHQYLSDIFKKHKGHFDEHIETSIPNFRTNSYSKMHSLVKSYPDNARMLDIASSEGSLGKTITEASGGRIQTTNLDPQEEMVKTFQTKSQVPGAESVSAAFGASFEDEKGNIVPKFAPKHSYDVVHESMAFQFFGPEREEHIAEAKRLLAPDGIFLSEEKVRTDNEAEHEAKKDAWKAQYHTPEALQRKQEQVGFQGEDTGGAGMMDKMVHQDVLESLLKKYFKYVAQYWSSGNFKGYVASDSKQKINSFLSNYSNEPHQFETESVPRRLHAKESKWKISNKKKKSHHKFQTSAKDHKKSVKYYGSLKTHNVKNFKKKSVLNEQQAKELFSGDNQFLYHSVNHGGDNPDEYEDAMSSIFQHGILPRTQTGKSSYHGWYESRPHHAYLGTRDKYSPVTAPQLMVDMSMVDPQMVKPDEDYAFRSIRKTNDEDLAKMGVEFPQGNPKYQSLGQWMDEHGHVLDTHENVKGSIDKEASIAVKGGVPADAVYFSNEHIENKLNDITEDIQRIFNYMNGDNPSDEKDLLKKVMEMKSQKYIRELEFFLKFKNKIHNLELINKIKSMIQEIDEVNQNIKMSKWKKATPGQRGMAIGDEIAETTFESLPEISDPEDDEKIQIVDGKKKKWKMVRPKDNPQPATYKDPKSGWGFYSKWKISANSVTEQRIQKIVDKAKSKGLEVQQYDNDGYLETEIHIGNDDYFQSRYVIYISHGKNRTKSVFYDRPESKDYRTNLSAIEQEIDLIQSENFNEMDFGRKTNMFNAKNILWNRYSKWKKISIPPAEQAKEFAQKYEQGQNPEDIHHKYPVRGHKWEFIPENFEKLYNIEQWPLKTKYVVQPLSKEDIGRPRGVKDMHDWSSLMGEHHSPGERKAGIHSGAIYINPLLSPEAANEALWHELQHAYQHQEKRWGEHEKYTNPVELHRMGLSDEEIAQKMKEYYEHPMELDANAFADFMRQYPLIRETEPYYNPNWVPEEHRKNPNEIIDDYYAKHGSKHRLRLPSIKSKWIKKEAPARSKAQFRYMQGICNGSIEPPEGMTRSQACEYVQGQKNYKDLPSHAEKESAEKKYARYKETEESLLRIGFNPKEAKAIGLEEMSKYSYWIDGYHAAVGMRDPDTGQWHMDVGFNDKLTHGGVTADYINDLGTPSMRAMIGDKDSRTDYYNQHTARGLYNPKTKDFIHFSHPDAWDEKEFNFKDLSADQRKQMEKFWRDLAEQNGIDIDTVRILNNNTGHFEDLDVNISDLQPTEEFREQMAKKNLVPKTIDEQRQRVKELIESGMSPQDAMNKVLIEEWRLKYQKEFERGGKNVYATKWKIAQKDSWEAVLDGELGHDIITTGTWEEVKKQTIKWLKQLKDGYINKKNPHDNKKIDAEAKEQDAHALEDLKLYEEKKRWSFHFDHGKHPYDLIIQPVGYKESKWKIC